MKDVRLDLEKKDTCLYAFFYPYPFLSLIIHFCPPNFIQAKFAILSCLTKLDRNFHRLVSNNRICNI